LEGASDGNFSVKSYYYFLNFGGLLSPWNHIWSVADPLKVKKYLLASFET